MSNRVIYLSQDATIAALFAEVWGELNREQGFALLSATNCNLDEPFRAAREYLATIGFILLPIAPAAQ